MTGSNADATAPTQRILITGSAGVIGSIIARDLRKDHLIRGFGRHTPSAAEAHEFIVGALEDEAALDRAMVGVDAVVHLAANADPEADWGSVLRSNIIGTRNVFEAAHKAEIRRVVFGSSNHASGIDTREGRQATASRPPAAPNLYGVSKAFGEVLGHQYAYQYGMSVICLRIGWIGAQDDRRVRPGDVDEVTEKMWISHRDLNHIVRRALVADVRYGVYFAMSSDAGAQWDLADAQRGLGYTPRD